MQRRHEFGLELCVNLGAVVSVLDVAADVCIEEHGINDFIAVRTETFNRDVHVKPDVVIDDAERNRAWRPVLVPDYFFGVEIVNALVAPGIAAEGETVSYVEEDVLNVLNDGFVVVED